MMLKASYSKVTIWATLSISFWCFKKI